jgi:hypothetical protein
MVMIVASQDVIDRLARRSAGLLQPSPRLYLRMRRMGGHDGTRAGILELFVFPEVRARSGIRLCAGHFSL